MPKSKLEEKLAIIKQEMKEVSTKKLHLMNERDDLDEEIAALNEAEEDLRLELIAVKKSGEQP